MPVAWANSLGIKVGNATGLPGTYVQVPVCLNSAGQVTMLQFDLSYDPAVLDWQAVALAEGCGGQPGQRQGAGDALQHQPAEATRGKPDNCQLDLWRGSRSRTGARHPVGPA